MGIKRFEDYAIENEILEGIRVLGYETPTEVQEVLLDKFSAEEDVVVLSQTGSGKTAAFGIPLLNDVLWEKRAVQALVLVPTRELAQQVQKELFQLGRYKRLNIVSVYGRDSMNRQIADLASRCHVVVGTPGRIMDHIQRGTIDLSEVKTLVLDEVDEMLKLGFYDQVVDIQNELPQHRSIMLSATLNPQVESIIKETIDNPQIIEVQNSNAVETRINHEYVVVEEEEKDSVLLNIMIAKKLDSAIIFCNRRHRVNEIHDFLKAKNLSVGKIHGNMDQKTRTEVMKRFKRGEFRYLVATDVAARGLDVDNIIAVINVDLPDYPESFTHRVGRTARLEDEGIAITLLPEYLVDRYKREFVKDSNRLALRQLEPSDKQRIDFLGMQNKNRSRKKQEAIFDDITKLHIKSGKKQKMRAGDVVGAITSIAGVSAMDIGVIQVLEESTYVEILNNKGKIVRKELSKLPIKGKVRRVEVAYKTEN